MLCLAKPVRWLRKLTLGIEPTQFARLRIKAKYAKSQKGVIFLLAQRAKAKTTKRSNVCDFGKKQNLPKRQKWQIAPAMSAITVA